MLELLLIIWLGGALIDMAVRAGKELATWSKESPFGLVWKALVWPGMRPLDVLKAIWDGVRRVGSGL